MSEMFKTIVVLIVLMSAIGYGKARNWEPIDIGFLAIWIILLIAMLNLLLGYFHV